MCVYVCVCLCGCLCVCVYMCAHMLMCVCANVRLSQHAAVTTMEQIYEQKQSVG
jgi:hypothetical protein